MALGPQRKYAAWCCAGDYAPVAAGLVVGMAAALAAGRLVHSLLFGVAPTDALTLAGVAAALASVAMLACLLPAHAAARIDPARVLRDE